MELRIIRSVPHNVDHVIHLLYHMSIILLICLDISFQLQRKLRSGKRSGRDEDYGAYRVVGGKKGFNDNYGAISFEEDPPVLWLVVKKGDEKTGRCISSLSEWALENYNVDLAVVEKDPRNRVASEDILVFLEKKTSANECEEIANDIAEADGLSDRKRGGVFDNVENIAFFDVSAILQPLF